MGVCATVRVAASCAGCEAVTALQSRVAYAHVKSQWSAALSRGQCKTKVVTLEAYLQVLGRSYWVQDSVKSAEANCEMPRKSKGKSKGGGGEFVLISSHVCKCRTLFGEKTKYFIFVGIFIQNYSRF